MSKEPVAIELQLGDHIFVAGRTFVLTSVYDDTQTPASVTFVTPEELMETTTKTVMYEADDVQTPMPADNSPRNYVYGMLRRATSLSRKDADKLSDEIVDLVRPMLEKSKGNV